MRKNLQYSVTKNEFLRLAGYYRFHDVTSLFSAQRGLQMTAAEAAETYGMHDLGSSEFYQVVYAGTSIMVRTANGEITLAVSSATGAHVLRIMNEHITDYYGTIETYTEPKRAGTTPSGRPLPSLLSAYRRAFAIWL